MTKLLKITIEDKLPSANEYIKECRNSKFGGNTFKKETEEYISLFLLEHRHITFEKPVRIKYHWIEPNMKRDIDNIAFAKKFINDALVAVGILKNDGWKDVVGLSDNFSIDKENPRIEIEITEME